MIITILVLIACILLCYELIMLILDFKKWKYINNNQVHSIEHIAYIIALIVVLLLAIIQVKENLVYLILSFSSLLIFNHLKNERIWKE